MLKQVQLDERDMRRIFKSDNAFGRVVRFLRRVLRYALNLTILFGLFFVLLNYGAYWKRLNYSVAAQPPTTSTPAEQPTPQPQPEPAPEPPKPDYAPSIEIAKIGVTAPVLIDIQAKDTEAKLVDGVVHMAGTALPGELGNAVMTGHSSDFPWSTGKYKTVFALLDKLVLGDEIIVPYKEFKHIYRVTEVKTIKPTDTSILYKTEEPTLTLITCYPVGSTRSRLIIRARLESNTLTGPQSAELPPNSALPKSR